MEKNNDFKIVMYKPTCLGPSETILRMFSREELLNSKSVMNVLEKAREAENKQLLEKMQKAMSESFAINPDKLFCTRGDITATEEMRKMPDDRLDALAYSQVVYMQTFGVPVPRYEPNPKVFLGESAWLSTAEYLEKQLKNTAGKARRKIRRQLRKWRRKS